MTKILGIPSALRYLPNQTCAFSSSSLDLCFYNVVLRLLAVLSNMEDYTYSPLLHGEIRLLVLLPQRSGEPATCTEPIRSLIIHVPRDQAPEYDALSYCWGKSNTKHIIHVGGGKALTVGDNLFTALSHLRGEVFGHRKILWIDAICINQQDKERNFQVLLMDSIYARAYRVVIWLGLAPESKFFDSSGQELSVTNHQICQDLMFFVQYPHIAARVIERRIDPEVHRAHIFSTPIKCRLSESPAADQYHAGFLRTLAFVLADPWLGRRWVIQELAFARRAVVQWGRCRVEWASLVEFVHHIEASIGGMRDMGELIDVRRGGRSCFINLKTIEGLVFASTCLAREKQHNGNEESLTKLSTLYDLVIKLAGFNTTDPRDLIYSILSLASDGSAIEPDYRKPPLAVFMELVEHVVTTTFQLEILCHPWARLCEDDDCLPSWVNVRLGVPLQPRSSSNGLYHPQRFEQPLLHMDNASNYAASKGVYAGCSFFTLDKISKWHLFRILRAPGLQVDRIFHLGITAEGSFISYRDSSSVNESGHRKTTSRFFSESFREPFESKVSNDFFKVVTGGDDTTGIDLRKRLDYVREELRLSWKEEGKFQDWMKPLYDRIELVCCRRRLMLTESNLLGLVPHTAKVNDLVCVLFGCRVPLILRPHLPATYKIVGDFYVEGLMKGQAVTSMENGKLQKMDFDKQ